MATLGGYYLNPHDNQFDGSTYEDSNCTPTTGDNGANAATGGRINKSGNTFRALIPRWAETHPASPGWSLEDLDHACTKIGVPFTVKSGQGWGVLLGYLSLGHYVALQGDTEEFSSATCSGDFNGDHCIGIHPATRVVNGLRQHWIDDPICQTGRWEYDYILRRYAVNLSAQVRFGVFMTKVPRAAAPPAPPVHLYPGATLVKPPKAKRISVGAGKSAVVRAKPTRDSKVVTSVANGSVVVVYQRTIKGQLLAGSRGWYGIDRSGTRWIHSSSF